MRFFNEIIVDFIYKLSYLSDTILKLFFKRILYIMTISYHHNILFDNIRSITLL